VSSNESPGTLTAFGEYLRAQRRLAHLTLRELAEMTRVSNPYLSQIERGLHQPSIAVIKSLAEALNVSVESLLAQAAGIDNEEGNASNDTESAIRADKRLTAEQKEALLTVYRGFVGDATPRPTTARTKRAPAPTGDGKNRR
jgi:transcriptional regulator with XRE-family HTH domain